MPNLQAQNPKRGLGFDHGGNKTKHGNARSSIRSSIVVVVVFAVVVAAVAAVIVVVETVVVAAVVKGQVHPSPAPRNRKKGSKRCFAQNCHSVLIDIQTLSNFHKPRAATSISTSISTYINRNPSPSRGG